MELRQGSSVQSGNGRGGDTPPSRIHWTNSPQDFGMDETENYSSPSGEEERHERTSHFVLPERLRARRDICYDKLLDYRRELLMADLELPNAFPVLFGFQSSWEELKRLFQCHSIEDAEETSSYEDETDD